MTDATSKTICLIDGHPDPDPKHYIHALADAYETGAEEAGHVVRRIDTGSLDIRCLRTPEQFYAKPDDKRVEDVQDIVSWSDHVVLMFPMWYGGIPAHTRGFLEHLGRGGFLLAEGEENKWPRPMMKGKSLRIVMTMGMPSAVYRLAFGAFGVRSLEKGVFGISGFHPMHHTLIGMVEAMGNDGRLRWLEKMRVMGSKAR